MSARRMPFPSMLLLTVLIGLSTAACGSGKSSDVPAGPVGSSSEGESEDGGVYVVPMTEAEEVTLSCGEYGFGMGLDESDLPMVRCIIDKSEGVEGRANLLNGMMIDAIHSSNQDAVQLLLGSGVTADGESPNGEPFLVSALNNLTFMGPGAGHTRQGESALAIADILVAQGVRIMGPPGEEYVNAWFIAVERSADGVRIMIRAGMDVNVRRPLDEQFNVETELVHAVRRACWSDVSEPDSPELGIVQALVEGGADVNTMSIGQILDEDLNKVIGMLEGETVLSTAKGGQTGCPQVARVLREAGACERLEGRRVEWGSNLDFEGIAKVVSAASAFPPREDVACADSE